ncbi:MAG TPA: rod shape-determining protein MreD [Candidatus Angelobacter sp.]|jgi:rod shape-determining protein MreD|nr:rod shape-determining protein MreD [Candidatus Angelobacter sp.]
MSVAVSYTSREEIEVHKFSWAVSVGIPLLAIFIQVFFPIRLRFLMVFDLPLLVTIYFAVARRRPIPGLITGALIGTVQDAFGHHYIGLNGIAKTIIGFLASSLGVRLDVENPGSRFIMTFGFYLLHQVIRTVIDVLLVGTRESWIWGHTLVAAIANGLLAVVLFVALDKLKLRA